MILKVLASSSRGNSYILDDGSEKLLIECGIAWKEIQRALNFNTSDVAACICSHSHKDHTRSFKDVIKSGIDVYTSQGTIDALNISGHRARPVKALQQFKVGNWTMLPFETEHDCNEPLGFLIVHELTKFKILFATDTYFVRYKFKKLNAIMLECNYCKNILDANIDAGYVPQSLANRLLESHFSLGNVKGFLSANDLSEVRKIVLIHLSDGNSDAKRMVREIEEMTGKEVVVADAGMEIPLELCPF